MVMTRGGTLALCALLVCGIVDAKTLRASADATCPTQFTLTSTDCSQWCTKPGAQLYNGCNIYPKDAEFKCDDTSIGYCAPLADSGCQVKCFTKGFLVADPDGTQALELGMRGTWGSWGRAEPVQVISSLELTDVTKLSLKDYHVNDGQEPLRRVVLQDAGLANSEVTTLELINVFVDFPAPSDPTVLPSGLRQLVLNNNRLARTANSSSSLFPDHVFAQEGLKTLDISGNPDLTADSFSAEERAFFGKIEVFIADFDL